MKQFKHLETETCTYPEKLELKVDRHSTVTLTDLKTNAPDVVFKRYGEKVRFVLTTKEMKRLGKFLTASAKTIRKHQRQAAEI